MTRSRWTAATKPPRRRAPARAGGPARAPIFITTILAVAAVATDARAGTWSDPGQSAPRPARAAELGLVSFSTRALPDGAGDASFGVFRVFEDRVAGAGRTLDLELVVLHARGEAVAPDPVVVLAGGPGQDATSLWRGYVGSWMRARRDVVFLSQRGTGGSHRLDVELAGRDDDLQTYFDPIFDVGRFRAGLARLGERADLRCYSTAWAMDDLADALTALGYDRVDVTGGSYGTRAGLVFLRRHPDRVRAAILRGVAPLAFKNPLYHARSAQEGFERIVADVAEDPAARLAYPDLRGDLTRVLARLEAGPVEVEVSHPVTRRRVKVALDAAAFGEALRVMMYYTATNRQVPMLLHRAALGDFTAFAERGLASNRSLRRAIAFGMLMCVTATEDLARITEEEIVAATRDTFLGDVRVRSQRAVGEFWPRSPLPPEDHEPTPVDVPVLIVSGSHDPVTPPRWGEEAHRHLPNSVHVVVPSAHDVSAPGLDAVLAAFLRDPRPEALDLSVLAGARMPRVILDV